MHFLMSRRNHIGLRLAATIRLLLLMATRLGSTPIIDQVLRIHKAKDSSGHYISWPKYNFTLHPEPLYLMGLRRAPISTVPPDIGWPRYLEIQRAYPNALSSLFQLLSF
jgi:hypothetical protein